MVILPHPTGDFPLKPSMISPIPLAAVLSSADALQHGSVAIAAGEGEAAHQQRVGDDLGRLLATTKPSGKWWV